MYILNNIVYIPNTLVYILNNIVYIPRIIFFPANVSDKMNKQDGAELCQAQSSFS